MDEIRNVAVLGPLAVHADGLRSELARLGYARGTAENHMRVIGHLSQWMALRVLSSGNSLMIVWSNSSLS